MISSRVPNLNKGLWERTGEQKEGQSTDQSNSRKKLHQQEEVGILIQKKRDLNDEHKVVEF